MKRLTERRKNGAINVRYATEHETAIHRLAAIEDILGDDYDLDRLRELVEMDKANSVPPCQIGDVFYAIDWSRWGSEVKKYRISMLQQKRDKAWRIRAKDTQSHHQVDWAYDDYREQAYSTHEAAEAALAKLNSET